MANRRRQSNRTPARQQPPKLPAPPGGGQVTIEQQFQAQSYVGPLPHPDILRQYDQVIPGLAERLVRQWEVQSEHRQGMERAVVAENVASQKRGAWLGFVLSLVLLGLSGALMFNGHTAGGVALASADIAGVAGAFVYTRWDQRQERQQKFEVVQKAARKR